MGNINKQLADIFSDMADGLLSGQFGAKKRIGLTLVGSEHGADELHRAAKMVARQYPDIEPVLIGQTIETEFELHQADDLHACHSVMEALLKNNEIDGCVTLHYNFPLGVSTFGKVVTPSLGREMIIASTTGTTDTHRIAAMLKNTINGIALAKATGINQPTVGILNIDGAALVERYLKRLQQQGYDIRFTESSREDGGVCMRGNDLLKGTPDVMVTDSLTGNLMMKMFSSFTTGGSYEASGYGYGPGLGEGSQHLVAIISRASGAPVIAGAMRLCADAVIGQALAITEAEMKLAKKAGLDLILTELKQAKTEVATKPVVVAPATKITDADISGIDILEIEDACESLWSVGIFARTGMGCTGPIVMIAAADKDKAREHLHTKQYL
ncbi:hypothetical protein HWQ46_16815 [Shewanella sp. D64]|uniref:glycine/sarcosine/betaine reductase complex component C subunit alpha n=1 Tax=unclassified Shewanella TaxID=196818 RepID=UPI0022BA52BF|nr:MULTISPECIES: glycine/sarcosine/betaine reductase complex component C subunit alpha [unclassified Shewanella]MEC4727210.1 hypothetical protein [Shewanella sp. D64]MEC4739173.1 hypothetical protein [Shewanella sp. E94]WBJ95516.1 hypothetical protein HWQ47_27700 [Shewanella sp. MTB7]